MSDNYGANFVVIGRVIEVKREFYPSLVLICTHTCTLHAYRVQSAVCGPEVRNSLIKILCDVIMVRSMYQRLFVLP